MAAQITILASVPGGAIDGGGTRILRVYGTIALSGNYPANGDTLNFTTATWPVGMDGVKASGPPILVSIQSQPVAGSNFSGYEYGFVQGTTQANGKIQVFQCAGAGNPLSQLGAGAYPGAITGDNILFEALFAAI